MASWRSITRGSAPIVALAFGVSCSAAAPAPPVAPAAASAPEPPGPEPGVDNPGEPDAPIEPEPPVPPRPEAITLQLNAKGETCTLVFKGAGIDETEGGWYVAHIKRAATQKSDGCEAGELSGIDAAAKAVEQEALEGGGIAKPGGYVETWNMFRDLNFDGYGDLCLIVKSGAYSYSHLCWLFDTTSRRFRRYPKLDEFIALEVDDNTQTLAGGYRLGGPEYMRYTLGWHRGELVIREKILIDLGSGPGGAQLPEGHHYEVVFTERRGKLVKVRERIVRTPPP